MSDRIRWTPDIDAFRPAIHPKRVQGYVEAVETIYRVIGGDISRPHSSRSEQEEIDLYVVSGLLWQVMDVLLHLPERIAVQVWNTSPLVKQS